MKIAVEVVNTLPALPFGAFKIGCRIEIDASAQPDVVEKMANAVGIPIAHLWINGARGIPDPIVLAHLLNSFSFAVHGEQYKLAANLPGYMFSLPQLPKRSE